MSVRRRTFRLAAVACALLVGAPLHGQLVDWKTLAIRGTDAGPRGRQLNGFVPAVGTYEQGGECAVAALTDSARTVMRAYPSFAAARQVVLVHLRRRTPVGVSEFRFERGVALPTTDTEVLTDALHGDSVRAMRHMRLYVDLTARGSGSAENDYLIVPRVPDRFAIQGEALFPPRSVSGPRELFDGATKLGSATSRARRVLAACDVAADAR